jgi:hypothetical protein
VVDWVAGLLVVLYAQPLAAIVRLRTEHVTVGEDGQVRLRLGQAPVLLVEPLARPVLQLVATRKGHATVGHPGTSPWLPGGRPGRLLGSKQLWVRLNHLGIAPRPAARPRCCSWPASFPPRSWPGCLASAPTASTPGSASPVGTGPATPHSSAAAIHTLPQGERNWRSREP